MPGVLANLAAAMTRYNSNQRRDASASFSQIPAGAPSSSLVLLIAGTGRLAANANAPTNTIDTRTHVISKAMIMPVNASISRAKLAQRAQMKTGSCFWGN
jgi:hypothetical protein